MLTLLPTTPPTAFAAVDRVIRPEPNSGIA